MNMSICGGENLELVFKPNILNDVTQKDVLLLAKWIEETLSKMDLEDNNRPKERLIN